MDLHDALTDEAERCEFSGVASVRVGGSDPLVIERGLANRESGIPIGRATPFGIASGTKGITALTVASLVEDGALTWATRIRDLVEGLDNVDPAVTIEQLARHVSGVGDYLDEELQTDIDEPVLTVPAESLMVATDYFAMVAEPVHREPPGTVFRYNNGGYIMLSIAVEVLTGKPFHEAAQEHVLDPAGMKDSVFHVANALPSDVALGYLADGTTNFGLLPYRGAGDGGMYTTVDDVQRLWDGLARGSIVDQATFASMSTPVGPQGQNGYGLGFWLSGHVVTLEGIDPGVSFYTSFEPATARSLVIISNTSSGAWPMARAFDAAIADTPALRLAVAADERAVVECVRGAYAQYVPLMDREPAPMLDDYAELIERGLVTVAVTDDELVGLIVMWPRDDHFYVDNVAVDVAHQGEGVGSMLLGVANVAARRTGHDRIRLYTNEVMEQNITYYPRRGFVETNRIVENGYNRIYFEREVAPS